MVSGAGEKHGKGPEDILGRRLEGGECCPRVWNVVQYFSEYEVPT